MGDVYEIRLDGRLGRRLLRHIGWASRVRRPATVVRVRVTQADLDRLLARCTAAGLEVEQVHRLDAAPPPPGGAVHPPTRPDLITPRG